jgi:hypothetical protein
MTKDFTKIGRVSPVPKDNTPQGPVHAPARNQRIVIQAILFSALAFFLAGVWLVLGKPSPIPQEVSFIVGVAFIASAAVDLIVIKFIKRAWANKQG